jgi:catechol 2,3-dioxygenase-like lactoylglutathione lyase family enzyme
LEKAVSVLSKGPQLQTAARGQRDLKGEWLDRLTGIPSVLIQGEHLVVPGYPEDHPTLEIFSYIPEGSENLKSINKPGLSHLAFEVEDVREALKAIIEEGGGQVGEVVEADYPNNVRATFVYATDIEGNIIELQSWQKI